MCFPFGKLSLELKIHLLKYLLRTGQVQTFQQLVAAYYNELSPYVLVVKADSEADPLKFPRLPTIDLEEYCKEPMPERWATNCPIRILSLSKLQDIKNYKDSIRTEYILERLLHSQWATVVTVHGSTRKTFQYFLRKVCTRKKCPFVVIEQPRRGISSLFDSNTSICLDCSEKARVNKYFATNHDHIDDEHELTIRPTTIAGRMSQAAREWIFRSMALRQINFVCILIECIVSEAKAVDIVNCPSMERFLNLSTNTESVSIQLKDGCHQLEMDNQTSKCTNPTIKVRAPHMKSLEVFFSGCKHPVIECDQIKVSDYLSSERGIRITNTDFSDETPYISGCQHGEEGVELDTVLPPMRFTTFFALFWYYGVRDSFLKLTSWENAQALRWKRPSSLKSRSSSTQIENGESSTDILLCPEITRLTIFSVPRKDDPITVSFHTPRICALELFGLEGGDTGWDVLQLLDHQNDSDNSQLNHLRIQLATDEEVLLPLDQIEPFKKSLRTFVTKGYSTPCIWLWNGTTQFEQLVILQIDISHIPSMESVGRTPESSVHIDFSNQFPKLEVLYIMARLNYSLKFCSKNGEGVDLSLKTCKALIFFGITPSIKTRSVMLNEKRLDFCSQEPPLSPFYTRSWYLDRGDGREYWGKFEEEEFGDSLRYW